MQTLARMAIARRPCVRSEAQLSEILAPWLTRQSLGPRRLRDPGPSTLELKLMLAAAGNVSDHGRLRPCRIAVVSGEQRERFAEAFLRYAASARGLPSLDALDEATQENECEKAFNAPCLLAVLARIDGANPEVPAHEQWISVGASLGGLMSSANALGYVGKALSGARAAHPAVQAVLCEPAEVLVCFVYIGSR